MNKFLEECIHVIVVILFMCLIGYIEYLTYNNKNIYVFITLFSMLTGWFKYNTNKKSLLFYIGILYITIPMLYWYINKDEEILILFIKIICIYNILSFFLFKIIDGLQITINRISLKRIINTITAFIIPYFYLHLKFLNNDNVLLLHLIGVTLLFTVILLTSDFILTKIKPLSENNDIKELSTTESIVPTHGIIIKMVNSFLFISYIYIIYVAIMKLI